MIGPYLEKLSLAERNTQDEGNLYISNFFLLRVSKYIVLFYAALTQHKCFLRLINGFKYEDFDDFMF